MQKTLVMDGFDTITSSESPESSLVEAQADEELFELVLTDKAKAYRCTQADCGKIFRFKSEMKRHVVIHFKDRPYPCSFPKCNKTFKRSDALNNHLKTHTVKLSLICTYLGCDETFSTKSALNYHLLKHKGIKIFKCSYPGCSRTFLTQAQLKQHEGATTYHKRIFSSSETDHSSSKHCSSHDSDVDTFLGSEEFFDSKYNQYDLDGNELVYTDFEAPQKTFFNTQFQNESLNTLSGFLDGIDQQPIEDKTPEFAVNQNIFNTDAIKSKFMNFMDQISYNDQDFNEKLTSCMVRLEKLRNRDQNYIENKLDVDLFFKSSSEIVDS